MSNPFGDTLTELKTTSARQGYFYSLPSLEKAGIGRVARLPISIRIVLESVLRNCDGVNITEQDVTDLANWNAKEPSTHEIPFVVSRIVLQDFTGVPLLVDLAAMRSCVGSLGKDPALIEPLVPVDLVVDHSIQVDRSGSVKAFEFNLKREFERNIERYRFLKWGQKALKTFRVVPPAIGIVHQVNLEYLAKMVFEKEIAGKNVFYPDTLVGTDSHTTMINGLGIVGWGVGGIEAEAGMLGQPVYFQTPEVIGVYLSGQLLEGVTATDLTLHITQMLREEKVVGKFVEFFGPGASALTLADRATIANMAPEYGATMGFFPIDDQSLQYLKSTGRTQQEVDLVRDYYQAQGMFGVPDREDVDYTKVLELDLRSVVPCVSGPKRPQDRINVPDLKDCFNDLFEQEVALGGFGKDPLERSKKVSFRQEDGNNQTIGHGSVLIAAITSCTNTSNPSVMVAAGLVAKKAVEAGLRVPDYVKTSLAPGSRVVSDYLLETGLQEYFDELGFNLVGYGCTTCIGNSGPLDEAIEVAIKEGCLITASVLSGNRNFEARIHSSIRANFLMSPPLVVAFALAGRVDINLDKEPLGDDKNGRPVYLKDIWPTLNEIKDNVRKGLKPEMFIHKYGTINEANPQWNAIDVKDSVEYPWEDASTYIQNPPFFEDFTMKAGTIKPIYGMRPLLLLGDSVTTDHISPAGAIPKDGPAGQYLIEHGVKEHEFNSFGSRRGNDRVMTRGTFANVRIKNILAGGKEGGYTQKMPEGELMSIYQASCRYKQEGTPLIVLAGEDYGMGSSRDWAAKGTLLLGVKVVVAKSYERIHRSNLIGMGVLPLQFAQGQDIYKLNLDGSEVFSLPDLEESLEPRHTITLEIKRQDATVDKVSVVVRIDTPAEIDYYRHGGILPYVLRNILNAAS